ncbi:MAG: hypothetical protein QNJ42_12505 [Crocosphaera sp.]|nr:hypothetical protein [Crocosphaera sp.]
MNIPIQLKTKKLTSRQLLSMGFYVYKKTFNQFFWSFGLIYLPIMLIVLLIQNHVSHQFIEQLKTNFSASTLIFYFSFVFIIALIGLANFTFFYKTIVIFAYHYIYQKPFNYAKLSDAVFNDLFSLWVLMLRIYISYVLRSLLLLIPGIIYFINNSSVPLAFIFRQDKIGDAFSYNRSIIKENAGRVFSLFLYPFIIYLVFALLINRLLLSSIDISSNPEIYASHALGVSLFITVILVILFPILINSHLCLFLNAEAQKRLG